MWQTRAPTATAPGRNFYPLHGVANRKNKDLGRIEFDAEHFALGGKEAPGHPGVKVAVSVVRLLRGLAET